MVGQVLDDAPDAKTVEVSLFGPGYGESVLLHLGQGDWIIVDSCIAIDSKRPAALEYLDKIGVDSSKDVRLVVASHWHDDHVKGIAQMIEACEAADFACSVALQRDEFLTLVTSTRRGAFIRSSGVSEFAAVIDILRQRRTTTKWGLVDRDLWMRSLSDEMPEASVRCLSPSDASLERALKDISRLIPRVDETRSRIPAPQPNHAAVVLWVSVGTVSVLLGGDLEDSQIDGTGWAAVVDSATRPDARAQVYKVAHHGSANGHNPRIFSEMLVPDPYLVLAPFIRGQRPLPTKDDRKRLCSGTQNAYLCSPVRFPSGRRRDYQTSKLVAVSVVDIRPSEGPLGHIRLRRRCDAEPDTGWDTELSGAALPLCS